MYDLKCMISYSLFQLLHGQAWAEINGSHRFARAITTAVSFVHARTISQLSPFCTVVCLPRAVLVVRAINSMHGGMERI